MKIYNLFSALLAFRTLPTTALLVVIYAAIFTAVLVTDELPEVPRDQDGLDLDKAYADLQRIAAHPHPFNSHANDAIRSYILSRVSEVASQHSHVHVSSDYSSNASWLGGHDFGVYFEGTNVLVKILGTDPMYNKKGGVLFSAHYDSVSTAPGTTDDGIGVVTLLQMIEYLANNRQKRTAIFNINNGEEDGSHGAHVFLEHPWSKIPDSFLNLEGAASGGRPLLFRATSTAPLRAFLGKNVPHPHANVLSADAFSRGVIRSGTDYSAYTGPGSFLQGLDFAFYKGRSKYHTKDDSIPALEGGRKALWSMMEAARGAGVALLDDAGTHVTESGASGDAVYFDLFATTLVMFPLRILLTVNVILLVIGPIILFLLIITARLVVHPTNQNSSPQGQGLSIWRRGWARFRRMGWLKGVWKRFKFWLALVITIVLQVLLVVGYVKLNPFIVYSHPYLVLISTLSLAYLSVVLTLTLPIVRGRRLLPEQEKLTMLCQSYILSWIVLLFSTVALEKLKVGGVYFITAWNVVLFVGAVLGYIEVLVGARGSRDQDAPGRWFIRGASSRPEATYGENRPSEGVRADSEREGGPEATETTPLMGEHRTDPSSAGVKRTADSAIGWWILQLLVVVPLPVILVVHIGVLSLAALGQTLSDGSSPIVVYSAAALLSIFVVIPMAPFSVKVYRKLTFVLLIVFVATTAFNWLAFPFSQTAPLKIFFQQKLELDGTNVISAVTELTGVPSYLDSLIIPELPSSLTRDVRCASDLVLKPGLSVCAWESDLLPSPGGSTRQTTAGFAHSSDWLSTNVTRLSSSTARISVKGTNTRSCRLYFDSPIISYNISGSGVTSLQPGYEIPDAGVTSIRLWSRNWDREFTVDVGWNQKNSGSSLTGKVACEWTEYKSGTAGGVGTGGKIPALEEVLTFLPKWATVSKTTDGLVEAGSKFSV